MVDVEMSTYTITKLTRPNFDEWRRQISECADSFSLLNELNDLLQNNVNLAQPHANAGPALQSRFQRWNKLRGAVVKSLEGTEAKQRIADSGHQLVGQNIRQIIELVTANDAHLQSRDEQVVENGKIKSWQSSNPMKTLRVWLSEIREIVERCPSIYQPYQQLQVG